MWEPVNLKKGLLFIVVVEELAAGNKTQRGPQKYFGAQKRKGKVFGDLNILEKSLMNIVLYFCLGNVPEASFVEHANSERKRRDIVEHNKRGGSKRGEGRRGGRNSIRPFVWETTTLL